MATVINTPNGITESSLLHPSKAGPPAQLIEKRKQLKEKLIEKLAQQYGGDRLRRAIIANEVESCAALKAGTLKPSSLQELERAVARAVQSAAVAPAPAALYKRGDPKTDLAVNLKQARLPTLWGARPLLAAWRSRTPSLFSGC